MTRVHAAVNESILRSFPMQNDHFVPVQRDDCHVDIRPTHQCTHVQAKEKSFFNVLMSMVCFCLKTDKLFMCMCFCLLFLCYKGIEHKLHFAHCNCEPLAVTLTRAQLWPATPNNLCYACIFIFSP